MATSQYSLLVCYPPQSSRKKKTPVLSKPEAQLSLHQRDATKKPQEHGSAKKAPPIHHPTPYHSGYRL